MNSKRSNTNYHFVHSFPFTRIEYEKENDPDKSAPRFPVITLRSWNIVHNKQIIGEMKKKFGFPFGCSNIENCSVSLVMNTINTTIGFYWINR